MSSPKTGGIFTDRKTKLQTEKTQRVLYYIQQPPTAGEGV